jgi:hypothetical protein
MLHSESQITQYELRVSNLGTTMVYAVIVSNGHRKITTQATIIFACFDIVVKYFIKLVTDNNIAARIGLLLA